MVSTRNYNRIVLAIVGLGGVAAISGIVLLILGLAMPGTITFIGGAVAGLIAMMEWRCREKPTPTILVTPPPLKEIVVVAT